ncbi:MAG: hypothetical protein AAF514_13040 [Verrucomicrobiota bacterium]
MKKLRWIFAGSLLIAAGVVIAKGGESSGGPAAMGILLFGFSFLVLSAIFFSFDLVGILSAPFIRMIDGIYLPGGYNDKPPLSYELADYYAEVRDQPEKAIEQYEKIVRYYPRETMAYKKMIVVMREVLRDQERAEGVYRRAFWRVRSRKDRKELAAALRGNYGFAPDPEESRD